jgi:DNA polymerase
MYCGAHTKRFSGSGGNLNLQNLPRKEMFGVDLRAQIVAPEGSSFVVVDLSQIEVRTLCWLAKDWDTLKEIRGTDDMYEAFAIRFGLWNKEQGSMKASNPGLRQTVKGMVLGCGYGASAKKYAMIMKCSLEEAEKSVELYQTKMNKVVALWRKFKRDIKMSAKSGEYRVELPSGNAMHYKGVTNAADSLVCTMVRNGRPVLVRPWHGMITENCSQSLARDIFCYHLRKIEEAGHKIILHVHDEVVIECADADAQSTLANVVALMRTPPPWIPDIPLDAEGHTVKVYSK